ncbi:hypothetical protein CsSME_00007332 [Camellia sinensis var. sinensis]
MIEAIRINKLNYNEFRKYDELILKIIRAYDEPYDAFNIGGTLVKIFRSDIRLSFRIRYKTRRLDLSPFQRLVSDFIQRRSPSIVRITSKLVKTLFQKVLCGCKRHDEEDTVKLLMLYVCGKLFFSNYEETIS